MSDSFRPRLTKHDLFIIDEALHTFILYEDDPKSPMDPAHIKDRLERAKNLIERIHKMLNVQTIDFKNITDEELEKLFVDPGYPA